MSERRYTMGDVVTFWEDGVPRYEGVVVDHMLSGNNSYYRVVKADGSGNYRGPARWLPTYRLTLSGESPVKAVAERYAYLERRGMMEDLGTCTCVEVYDLVVENRRLARLLAEAGVTVEQEHLT